eukprot:7258872-Alexandrium_andersonii.AAC.1
MARPPAAPGAAPPLVLPPEGGDRRGSGPEQTVMDTGQSLSTLADSPGPSAAGGDGGPSPARTGSLSQAAQEAGTQSTPP